MNTLRFCCRGRSDGMRCWRTARTPPSPRSPLLSLTLAIFEGDFCSEYAEKWSSRISCLSMARARTGDNAGGADAAVSGGVAGAVDRFSREGGSKGTDVN